VIAKPRSVTRFSMDASSIAYQHHSEHGCYLVITTHGGFKHRHVTNHPSAARQSDSAPMILLIS